MVKVTATTKFGGYTDKAATEKKLISDVFQKGDTFRWKGENVSTAEVASELSKFPGVDEVNVYGVSIPNNEDGRAGMSAILMPDVSEENLAAFHRHASSSLPAYA